MARLPRLSLASIPQHLIQRGNNRQACFYADEDYRFYLECLGEAARKYRVSVHAYVLMTNHVHLLLTPTSAAGMSQVMQTLGRRYVRYINYTYRRSGTLWEGRYHASLVQGDRYLLTCYRYIEFNPVRANITQGPADYRWSSYHCNALGQPDPLIEPHEDYLRACELISLNPNHPRRDVDGRLAPQNRTYRSVRSDAGVFAPFHAFITPWRERRT